MEHLEIITKITFVTVVFSQSFAISMLQSLIITDSSESFDSKITDKFTARQELLT